MLMIGYVVYAVISQYPLGLVVGTTNPLGVVPGTPMIQNPRMLKSLKENGIRVPWWPSG